MSGADPNGDVCISGDGGIRRDEDGIAIEAVAPNGIVDAGGNEIHREWVAYETLNGPKWQLFALEYCVHGPQCHATFADRVGDRLWVTVRQVGPAIMLNIAAGWLFALGLEGLAKVLQLVGQTVSLQSS